MKKLNTAKTKKFKKTKKCKEPKRKKLKWPLWQQNLLISFWTHRNKHNFFQVEDFDKDKCKERITEVAKSVNRNFDDTKRCLLKLIKEGKIKQNELAIPQNSKCTKQRIIGDNDIALKEINDNKHEEDDDDDLIMKNMDENSESTQTDARNIRLSETINSNVIDSNIDTNEIIHNERTKQFNKDSDIEIISNHSINTKIINKNHYKNICKKSRKRKYEQMIDTEDMNEKELQIKSLSFIFQKELKKGMNVLSNMRTNNNQKHQNQYIQLLQTQIASIKQVNNAMIEHQNFNSRAKLGDRVR